MKTPFPNIDQSGQCSIGSAIVLAIALGSCVTADLRAQVIVVPNALESENGDAFHIAEGGSSSFGLRFMQIFDASQFGALQGPSLLTHFRFRPESADGLAGPSTGTYRLYASTTSRSVATMSTNFAENLGPDNTLVFDGTTTWATENLPGPGGTRQFDILIPLTTPFLYNPAEGNLLIDLQGTGSSGPGIQWDAVTTDHSVRAVIAPGSATSRTGSFSVSGVHQFTFEAALSPSIRTSQVEISWNSTSNLTYQVQYRSVLTTNLWTSLVDCFRSTNSAASVLDTVVAGQPQRFYQVVRVNCVP